MLKLLKWNSIDFLKKNIWLIFGMMISLLLAILPANGIGILNNFLVATAALLGFIVFQAGIVIAIGYCYRWLEGSSNILELSLPVPSWKQIISKLIIAALVDLISCIFVLQLFMIISNVADGSIQFITAENLSGIPGLVLYLLLIDATVQFSYIIVRCWKVTRQMSVFATALISLVILIAVTILIITIMSATNQIILPTISSDYILTIDGTLNIMSTAIPIWTSLFMIFMECVLGSLFLTKYFQAE
jgi:hypothetical protein